MLKVTIVLDSENARWILGKFARRLEEELPAFGVAPSVSAEPSPDADINHWILHSLPWGAYFRDANFFSGGWRSPNQNSTMLITHLDDSIKLRLVKELIEKRAVEVGIALSRMTRNELVRCGVEAGRLCAITPGHDDVLEPRRTVIGITTRIYPDGRKREEFIARLADTMSLSAFTFKIFGAGWDQICPQLVSAGAIVDYDPGSDDAAADYDALLAAIPSFDYYLYTGLDEGSMGFLDAVAAGVRTIVPPVGFNVDVPGGLTLPFQSFEELAAIFMAIASRWEDSRRLGRAYSWREYARLHSVLWKSLLAEGAHSAVARLDAEARSVGDPTLAESPPGERWRRIRNIPRSTAMGMLRESLPYRIRGFGSS